MIVDSRLPEAPKMKCNLENPKNEVAQKIMRTDGETGQYVNKTAVIFGFTFT